MSGGTFFSLNSGHSKSLMRSQTDDCSTLPPFKETDFYLNIDEISIGGLIGQGAFSKVYVGRYLGELVAIKKQKRTTNDALEDYLMRELAVLKYFEHPNLLSYIGASDVQEKCVGGSSYVCIVTELAEHGDLLALLLSDVKVNWKLRISILMGASRALEYLHSKNLIHRDIKSPNLLLDRNFNCKIADFGMAREIASNMTIVGTDAYMAPELMFDEPYNTSADMFSFGMVVWETIFRKKAGFDGFAERFPSEKFKLDCTTLAENIPDDTPASVSMLAQQLCEYEPDMRLGSEDTLLWLEDLFHEVPDTPDERHKLVPIDYGKIFDTSDNTAFVGKNLKNDKADLPQQLDQTGKMTAELDSDISPLNCIPKSPMNRNQDAAGSFYGHFSIEDGNAVTLSNGKNRNIIKAGYLHKKGKKGMKTWSKRFFVLEESQLSWYKDEKGFPNDIRGVIYIRSCFIVRGLYHRWKILNADGAADQQNYDRELSAKNAAEMEHWIAALEKTIDAADTKVKLNFGYQRNSLKRLQSSSSNDAFRDDRIISSINVAKNEPKIGIDMAESVSDWLNQLNLSHLISSFDEKKYNDMVMIQELGLTREDLDYIGITSPNERRLLTISAMGKISRKLIVRISGFYNFGGTELIYRVDSTYKFLRASTLFQCEEFENLHKGMKQHVAKDPKMSRLFPSLPTRPSPNQLLIKFGNISYASEMAKLQIAYQKYMDTLLAVVGTKDPYFELLCHHLELNIPGKRRSSAPHNDYASKTPPLPPGGIGGRRAGQDATTCDQLPPRLTPAFGLLSRTSFSTGRS